MRRMLWLWLGLGLGLAFMLRPGTAKPKSAAERLARVDEMYSQYREKLGGVADVSSDTLQAWLNREKVVLVDARTPRERAVSIIPGAISVEALDNYLTGRTSPRIVVYCTIGYRSGKLVRKLEKKGLIAFNLAGGILSWVHHGGPVEHEGQATRRVHVYGKKWNLLPDGYEAVW